jgi:outer membrane protein assembly factor BamB
LAGTPGAHQLPSPDVTAVAPVIAAFSLADGSITWTYHLGDSGLTTPQLLPRPPREFLGATSAAQYFAANGQGQVAFLACGQAVGASVPFTCQNDGADLWLGVANLSTGQVSGWTLTPLPTDSTPPTPTDPPVYPGILAYAGHTILITSSGGLTAIDDQSGSVIWTQQGGPGPDYDLGVAGSVVIADTWVYTDQGYRTIADGQPAPFGADVGREVEYDETPDGSVFRLSGGSTVRRLVKWDPLTGTPQWRHSVVVSGTLIAPAGDAILVQTPLGLSAYSLSRGTLRWTLVSPRLSLLGNDEFSGLVGHYAVLQYGSPSTDSVDLVDTGWPHRTVMLHLPHFGQAPVTWYLGTSLFYWYDDLPTDLRAFDPASPDPSHPLWTVTWTADQQRSGLQLQTVHDTFVGLTRDGQLSILR